MSDKRFDIVDPGNASGAYPAEIRGEYVRIMVDCSENFGEPLPIAQQIAAALNGDEASYAWHPSTAQTSQHPTQAERYEVHGTREAIDAFTKCLEGHEGLADALREAEQALDKLWAAIGDRLCGGGPLALAYGQAVSSEVSAARDAARAALAKVGSR